MNLDLSIHRMATREAETLGVAQALVARKRQELELKLLREQVAKDEPSSGACLEQSLRDMEDESRRAAPEPDSGRRVDRTA